MTTVLDGKGLALKLRGKIKEEVESLTATGRRAPHLAAILVGEDGASKTYVNSKESDCKYVGFNSTVHRLPAETSEDELLALINTINNNADIDGLIVQLPLPKHMDSEKITEA
ncbi:MAG: bifunctional methylenetetrahydrofolate dehydrogenase/methenyltetrahydrofolate cyclohydrolase FolD, partial [Bacteroidota bacterium]